MSGTDEEEVLDALQDFSIVHFIKRGRQSKVREMDIVPSKWLGFNKQNHSCLC